MESFDLAERLQTPIILMSDLDLGMNEWTTSPLKIDESKDWDRGKVLDAEELDNVESLVDTWTWTVMGFLIEPTQALIPIKEPFLPVEHPIMITQVTQRMEA